MLAKIQDYEIPPFPTIPEKENFEMGITTRLLAKNETRRSSGASNTASCISKLSNANSYSSKQSSRTEPVIKISNVNHSNNARSNEEKNKITETQNMPSNNTTNLQFQKLRESVRQRSRSSSLASGSLVSSSPERRRSSISSTSSSNSDRRVSQRTLEVMDIPGSRRSTQESIKEAIESSPEYDELVNVDKIYEINTTKMSQESNLSSISFSKQKNASILTCKGRKRPSNQSKVRFDPEV